MISTRNLYAVPIIYPRKDLELLLDPPDDSSLARTSLIGTRWMLSSCAYSTAKEVRHTTLSGATGPRSLSAVAIAWHVFPRAGMDSWRCCVVFRYDFLW